MADKLTEKQTQFIEEIKERFQDPEWSVCVWPKRSEAPGNWNTFKLLVLDFCMENQLYILEKPDCLLIGRSYNACEYTYCRIGKALSKMDFESCEVHIKEADFSRN